MNSEYLDRIHVSNNWEINILSVNESEKQF